MHEGRIVKDFKEIKGVRIESNTFVQTGTNSGILVGGMISTNVIRKPNQPTEYSVWGIHLATDDQLTFIYKSDDKPIIVKMIDCREGSSTLHNYLEVECYPDPNQRLVIPRGVAHLPTQVNGLLTLNMPLIYWDFEKRLVHPDLDVINIEKDRDLDKFPAYRVCRFKVPAWLYAAALTVFKERFKPEYEAPFIFDRKGELYVLRKKTQFI
jgi:hypothetical protein